MKTMTWRVGLAAFVLAAGAVGRAEAGLITSTLEVTASGSLNGTSFTDALVTFTETYDTTTVGPIFSGFDVQATTSTFDVAGVGSGSFTSSTGLLSRSGGLVLFEGLVTDVSVSVIVEENSPVLDGYDLTTSIGPVTGTLGFYSLGPVYDTTAGHLNFSSFGNGLTFTATAGVAATPEPATLAPACLAALAGVGCAWRKRRRVG
jgi:hypothetical protein